MCYVGRYRPASMDCVVTGHSFGLFLIHWLNVVPGIWMMYREPIMMFLLIHVQVSWTPGSLAYPAHILLDMPYMCTAGCVRVIHSIHERVLQAKPV